MKSRGLIALGLAGPATILLGLALAAFAQPAARPASATSTSQPATRTAADARISGLIAQLAGREYRARDAAQRQLVEMGELALPSLIEHINDPNPEIAARVSSIVRTPQDPDLRAALVIELLRTTRPEAIERASYMLFDDPEKCCDPFLSRVETLKGVPRRVADSVAEQLRTWKRQHDAFLRSYEKARQRNPNSAAHLLKLENDSHPYHAEAAYWSALDAIDEHLHPEEDSTTPSDAGAASQPARPAHRPAGTSRPTK